MKESLLHRSTPSVLMYHSPIWSPADEKYVGAIVAQLDRHNFAVFDFQAFTWQRYTRQEWEAKFVEQPPAMAPAMNPADPQGVLGDHGRRHHSPLSGQAVPPAAESTHRGAGTVGDDQLRRLIALTFHRHSLCCTPR